MKSLEIKNPATKVTETRIYSLAIHPSEVALTIATGDMKGIIGETTFTINIIYHKTRNICYEII